MLEREPPAAQPAGVTRTRCHRAEPAGPPRQQSQGSRITGHVPGHGLPQDPRVRDHHPGQLTGVRRPYWHSIEMAWGADPYLVPNWYLWVLTGAAVTWAGGRFIRPAGLAPRGKRGLLSGARRVRVTALMSLALVLVVASALLLIVYGIYQSEPAAVQAVDAASGSASPGQNDAYLWIGIILMGGGAVLARRARRLAAVDAYRLMQRDTRSPVLYLRSFG